MYFQKKTRVGNNNQWIFIVIKLLIIILFLFSIVFIIDKIDLPTPNKKIEKIISNENIRIVK